MISFRGLVESTLEENEVHWNYIGEVEDLPEREETKEGHDTIHAQDEDQSTASEGKHEGLVLF